MDAVSNAADAFTLITGDSDLAVPVQAIRYRMKKTDCRFQSPQSDVP